MAEAEERARDPDLVNKVIALLQEAIAANLAANPPYTPRLEGEWSQDPWEDLRPLSGEPANDMQQAAMMQQGGKR